MGQVDEVKTLLRRLVDLSDWKFAVGLHINFANPTLLYQNYPDAWIEYYQENNLVFVDPAVKWAVRSTGVVDWDDLRNSDPENVLARAEDHGLRFGKVISVSDTTRSCGFFAHSDAPIKDDDIEAAHAVVKELHRVTSNVKDLSDDELFDLRETPASVLEG